LLGLHHVGRTGGYVESFAFTATPNLATLPGQFAVLRGTGGLTARRGKGTFQGNATNTGFIETVFLNFHFEPWSPAETDNSRTVIRAVVPLVRDKSRGNKFPASPVGIMPVFPSE